MPKNAKGSNLVSVSRKKAVPTTTMPARWFPLECNPDVMSRYVAQLGLQSESRLAFHDVFGFEDDLLAMIPPGRLCALLLLYPISRANTAYSVAQIRAQYPALMTEKRDDDDAAATALIDSDTVAAADPSSVSAPPFFVKQTIANACGTIGIIHALMNNRDCVSFADGSFLANFAKDASGKSPGQLAALLESSVTLNETQAVAANEGQTNNQSIDTPIYTHFISFVEVGGDVWKLDGRLPGPIKVSPRPAAPATSSSSSAADIGSLLRAAADETKTLMSLDPTEVNFSCVACVIEE